MSIRKEKCKMVEKISCYILDNILYKNEEITGDEREIQLFGITRIVEDTPKYLFIFLVGLLLGILDKLVVVLLISICYKAIVGGAHARTNVQCFIISSLFFFIPILFANYIVLDKTLFNSLVIINYVLSLFIIYKYAPGDTEEVPILKPKKRKMIKYIGYASISILTLVMIFFPNIVIAEIMFITILESNILLTNLAYKLLKCKHSYESEEFKQYFNSYKE